MSKAILKYFLMGALGLGNFLFAQPDVEIKGDTIIYTYQLEEVVVYGEKSKVNTIQQIEIDQEELQSKQPLNIAEALVDNAAITVTTGTKGESSTKIRGFSSKDILVLIDGRPINPGTYGKVDLAMLPTDNVAKIKVVKGPASVAYGPNATGGVINIITKNGQEKPQTKLHGEVGDYNYRRLQFNHSNQYKKINYWFAGYEHHRDGFKLSSDFTPTSLENGNRRENSSYHKWGLNSKIGWQKSPKTLYSVSLGYHEAEKNVPYGTYIYLSNKYFRFPEWFRYHTSFDGYWILNDKLDLKGNFSYDSYQDRLKSYSNKGFDENKLEFNSMLKNFTYGTTWSGTYKLNYKHTLSFGLNSIKYIYKKKPDLDEDWFDHHTSTSSIFMEDNYLATASTTLRLGVGANFFAQEKKDPENYFAFSLLAEQKVPLQIVLNAGVSQMQRFPTLNNLYSQDYGNPNLRPEDGIKYEIGATRDFSLPNFPINFSLGGSVFFNDLENKIDKQKVDSMFTRYVNVHKARIGGFELESSWKAFTFFSGRFGYSHLKAYDYGEEMLYDVPENKINVQLQAEWEKFNVFYIFAYYDSRNTDYKRLLPSYNLHTLNFTYAPSKKLELQLKIHNIMDVYYEEEIGYPAPGRAVIGGFTFSL